MYGVVLLSNGQKPVVVNLLRRHGPVPKEVSKHALILCFSIR